MTTAFRGLFALAAMMAATGAAPALAELPESVRAMMEAAIASGDKGAIDTVAKFARQTHPGYAQDIEAMVNAHMTAKQQEREAKIREAGIFNLWRGNIEAGGMISTGNTKATGLSAGFSLTKEGIDWRHKFRAIVDYQRTDGITTRNQWMASYEPNFTLNDAIYAYGLAMYEKDRFQGFSDRVTASGGVGVRLIRRPTLSLDLKGGPAWRQTNWLLESDDTELNTLAGADFFWRLSPGFEFKNAAQAIWGPDNSTYSNTAALTGKLTGKLSARLSYGLRHETDPQPGAEKTDTITRATLVYDF